MSENFKNPKTRNVVNQYYVNVALNTEGDVLPTTPARGVLCITTTDELTVVEEKLREDYGFFSVEEPYGGFYDFSEYVEENHAEWTVTVWEPDLSVKLS